MKAKYVGSIVAASLALLASCAHLPGGDDAASLETLRKEKVKAAQDWVDAVTTSFDIEHVNYAKIPAYRALAEAQVEAALDQQSRTSAIKEYRRNLESVSQQFSALSQEGMKGGEAWRLAEVRFLLLEAEAWLTEGVPITVVPSTAGQTSPISVREERLKAAQDWMDSVTGAPKGEVAPLDVLPAHRALMNARLEMVKGKQDRIKVRRDYRDAAQNIRAKVEELDNERLPSGQRRFLAEAQFRLAEAQVWIRVEEVKE